MEKKARSKNIFRFWAVFLTFVMVLGTIPAAAKVKNSVTVRKIRLICINDD